MPTDLSPDLSLQRTVQVRAVAVLAVAIALFVGAFLAIEDGDDDPVLERRRRRAVVENLIPRRNAQVPQQSTSASTCDRLDRHAGDRRGEIPADELQITPEIGLIEFTPAEGKAVEEFDAGRTASPP